MNETLPYQGVPAIVSSSLHFPGVTADTLAGRILVQGQLGGDLLTGLSGGSPAGISSEKTSLNFLRRFSTLGSGWGTWMY